MYEPTGSYINILIPPSLVLASSNLRELSVPLNHVGILTASPAIFPLEEYLCQELCTQLETISPLPLLTEIVLEISSSS